MSKKVSGVNIKNRKAYYDYESVDEEIAGIVLFGSEIKSIRYGEVSISEGYCYIQDKEVYITGMYISEYKLAGIENHDPYRKRKLLLTKKQIAKFDKKMKTKGYTIIPVKLFIDDKGNAKLKIMLGKGKKTYDKKQSIKERDIKRDMDRQIK